VLYYSISIDHETKQYFTLTITIHIDRTHKWNDWGISNKYSKMATNNNNNKITIHTNADSSTANNEVNLFTILNSNSTSNNNSATTAVNSLLTNAFKQLFETYVPPETPIEETTKVRLQTLLETIKQQPNEVDVLISTCKTLVEELDQLRASFYGELKTTLSKQLVELGLCGKEFVQIGDQYYHNNPQFTQIWCCAVCKFSDQMYLCQDEMAKHGIYRLLVQIMRHYKHNAEIMTQVCSAIGSIVDCSNIAAQNAFYENGICLLVVELLPYYVDQTLLIDNATRSTTTTTTTATTDSMTNASPIYSSIEELCGIVGAIVNISQKHWDEINGRRIQNVFLELGLCEILINTLNITNKSAPVRVTDRVIIAIGGFVANNPQVKKKFLDVGLGQCLVNVLNNKFATANDLAHLRVRFTYEICSLIQVLSQQGSNVEQLKQVGIIVALQNRTLQLVDEENKKNDQGRIKHCLKIVFGVEI
jgi:hypothetical protein